MAKRTYRRTQYLVDRGYQIRVVTRIFLALLGGAVVSSLIAIGLLWAKMYRPEYAPHTLLIASLLAVAFTLLIELLLAIPIALVLGIKQSHQVVGPIQRISAALDAIGKGDFSKRITLREGDTLEGLVQAINRMAANLQQRSSK